MTTEANLTLWLVAVRRMLADTTDEAKRKMLREIYVEIARRMP